MASKKLDPGIKWDKARCKLCGLCVEVCPKKGLALKGGCIVQTGECIKCRMCEVNCPDFAIYVIKDDKKADAGK